MVDIYNIDKHKVSECELNPDIFALELNDVNKDLIYRTVGWQLSKRRSGSASTKTRGEVRGGGSKPWKQKNLGRARAGSNRSPLWRKGAITFGPKPKDWSTDLPKKMRRKALKVSLSHINSKGKIVIIDNLKIDKIKTRTIANFLNNFELDSALFVDNINYLQLKISSQNIGKVKVLKTEGLNVYDVLKFKNIVFSKDSIEKVQEVLGH
jgi:large subunit ribosomal protein L4